MRTRNLPTTLADRNSDLTTFSSWMDRIFDEVINQNSGTFVPTLNVSETDQTFEISVALPGMSRDDVEIHYENDVLTISGERKWKHEEKENGRRYHRVESGYGTFSRSLPLPNFVDSDQISAEFENGELIITAPKLKEKAGKKIEVK
ncbi:Hsp20/alpha crystallin family protein [Rhodohalobacter sp. 8-1]|uniref:Hsp20/alpha crystallin family protein n=1 Tax=Rhodohalobacter sp. 8-1 TaxID=3131972 RepID=UPI0030EE1E68